MGMLRCISITPVDKVFYLTPTFLPENRKSCPSVAGTQFTDPGWKAGRVSLGDQGHGF